MRIFRVENSRGVSVVIFAQTAQRAISIALKERHVRKLKTARIHDNTEQQLADRLEETKRALLANIEGIAGFMFCPSRGWTIGTQLL
jgi:hypothetical protein